MTTLAAGAGAGAGTGRRTLTRQSAASPWRHVDLSLVIAVVLLAAFGLLMIYSATRVRLEERGLDPTFYLQRQAMFVAIGLAVMTAVTLFDYRLYRDFAVLIYGGTVGILLLVLSPLGAEHKGQQASFDIGAFQLQPSEFAKIALIVCLAAYVSTLREQVIDGRRLLVILGVAGLPMGLIYLQPDLGTSLVFGAILMGMLLIGGAKARHLVLLLLGVVVAMVAVVQLGVLKEYQVARLTSFLDPTGDVAGAAYNLDQSKTAIGSGGFFGKGLFQGSQTNLSYVPEQHTDFIFTAVGEQLGFLGSAVMLALFSIVVWRTWRAAALARDVAGTLMCVGVIAMLTFQVFENVGMSMGIMPITGIPLPFVSYGGSSTLATFAGIGLVLNVHMRRFL
ncbi:MAG TPA: rod shape-determining protein RodA [Acidimicrobiales bacterium]|jgi:rod shape determining protein RodA|nr:rod shape-determining protein RodA [Acidimicrobiales bacterium]